MVDKNGKVLRLNNRVLVKSSGLVKATVVGFVGWWMGLESERPIINDNKRFREDCVYYKLDVPYNGKQFFMSLSSDVELIESHYCVFNSDNELEQLENDFNKLTGPKGTKVTEFVGTRTSLIEWLELADCLAELLYGYSQCTSSDQEDIVRLTNKVRKDMRVLQDSQL